MIRVLRFILTPLVLALAVATLTAQAPVPIRLATQAPVNSEWHNALRELADALKRRTQGRVAMQLYPGGTQGSEKAVVDRMITGGAVNAALLTAIGLSQIDDAFNVFGLPFFFQSDEEMRHVREKLTPMLAAKLEARRFRLLGWGEGGWVQLFSKRPIRTIADLKRIRLYTSEGNDKMVQWYKSNGFNPVAMPESEIVKQLKALNGIEAVPMPPYPASLLGLYRDTPYMLAISVAPLVGAAVVTTDVWNRLTEADRQALLDGAAALQKRVGASVPALDAGSITEMQKEGRDLKVIKLDAAAAAEFRAEAERLTSTVSGSIVPKDIFEAALRERNAYRNAR